MDNNFFTSLRVEFNKSKAEFAKLLIKTSLGTIAICGVGGSYFLPSMVQHDQDVLTFKKPAGFLQYSTSIIRIPFTSTGAFIRSVVDNNSTPPSPNP